MPLTAVVEMFGPTDLTQPAIYSWVQSLWLFNKTPYAVVPNLYRDASPIFVVSNETAPICIVQVSSTRLFRCRNRSNFAISCLHPKCHTSGSHSTVATSSPEFHLG